MKKDLLKSFIVGVSYPTVSGFEVSELLDARSAIAEFEDKLTKEEKAELEKADSLFLSNLDKFYKSVIQVADLDEMRKRAGVPPSHWWWHIERLVKTKEATVSSASYFAFSIFTIKSLSAVSFNLK